MLLFTFKAHTNSVSLNIRNFVVTENSWKHLINSIKSDLVWKSTYLAQTHIQGCQLYGNSISDQLANPIGREVPFLSKNYYIYLLQIICNEINIIFLRSNQNVTFDCHWNNVFGTINSYRNNLTKNIVNDNNELTRFDLLDEITLRSHSNKNM